MSNTDHSLATTGRHSDHQMPLRAYFIIYGALLVLTALTVGVSYANLGPASIYVAMLVAVIKASLVVGYFMHLKYDTSFNAIVFVSSLLFLGLFFAFTMIDLTSRDDITETEGNYSLRHDQAVASERAAHPPAPATSAKPAQSSP